MENKNDTNTVVIDGDSGSMEKSVLLMKHGQLNDIATLHQGFDIHRMPQNYLNKRSYIEKLIFHATMSDALKSPFSSFTMANRYLSCLDAVDVITGIRGLKLLAKLTLDANQRTSIMVHRIGNTWVLDEFSIDSFLLAGEQSPEWYWLRKFLMKKNFYLCSEAFSRSSLILRDLYIKFLYHTVGQSPHLDLQRTIASLPYGREVVRKSLPAPDSSPECYRYEPQATTEQIAASSPSGSSPSRLMDSPQPNDSMNRSMGFRSRLDSSSFGKQAWAANPDEYLHTAKWQLQDLSFLVGSDLAIFGTPMHPCISLKLSPMHESINVLTGVDMWLENILNEVPEVVMCYHREGIVMQEYEIYKTCDLPKVAGFETKQVYRTVQNLVMFLKRNATQEGHTYWLVKEPGLDVVKLYDLTTLCDQDAAGNHEAPTESNTNPFILPVATLCYRLAERRWKEYQSRRTGKLSGPTASEGSNDMFADDTENLLDALRLVRSCLNLINLAELSKNNEKAISDSPPTGLADLKIRAVLLVCQLYLVTPSDLITSCIRRLQSVVEYSREVAVLPVKDLTASEEQPKELHNSPSLEYEDGSGPLNEDEPRIKSSKRAKRRLLGNILVEALKSSDTNRMSQLAIGVIQSCNTTLPIAPSTCPALDVMSLTNDQNTCASNDILARFQVSTHETLPTVLLPISMLKIYLCKAQEFWARSQQHVSSKPSALSTCANYLRMVVRHTLPSLLVLEHLVPDQHTNDLATSRSMTIRTTCPYCGSPGVPDSPPSLVLDRQFLIDMLHIASCLFPASLMCYADAIRESSSEQRHLSDPIKLEPSDCLLLRASCPSSAIALQSLFEASIQGPLEAAQFSTCPPTPDLLHHWLELLYLAVRCLHRAFSPSDKPLTGKKSSQAKGAKLSHQQKKSKDQLKMTSSTHPGTVSVNNIPLTHVARLHISVDWWSVLVNMYVIALRRAFLEIPKSSDFPRALTRGLSIVRNPPPATVHLDGKSQFLTSTNEFQLYKLAAAAAQQDARGMWADLLRSLPADSNPILPVKTLIWEQDANAPPDGERGTDKFCLIAVCLARAIDSLLRHFSINQSWNASNEMVQTQLCSSILVTCNEYIATCLGETDSVERMDTDYISTLSTVMKQVMRRLPEDLSSSDPARLSSGVPPPLSLPKNMVLQMLDFRLNQMNIALQIHHNSSVLQNTNRSSQTWSTIVGQARAALNWHAKHMVLPGESGKSISTDVVRDLNMFLKLVNRLVSLESVNLNVLSLSGVMVILKDLSLTQPVVAVVNSRWKSDPAFAEQEEALKRSLQCLLHNLLIFCRYIVTKHQSGKPIKAERKSGGRKKSGKHLASDSHPTTSTEVELANSIIQTPEALQRLSLNSFDQLLSGLQEEGLDSLALLCPLVTEKLKRLSTYFTQG